MKYLHTLPVFSYIMATNVQFFVHGGNTVCMTVNAQRQPPLLRLSKRSVIRNFPKHFCAPCRVFYSHLECGRRVQVVVGPWSLHAVLLPMGTEVGRNQPSAEKQWEEWREFVAPLVRDIDEPEEESLVIAHASLTERFSGPVVDMRIYSLGGWHSTHGAGGDRWDPYAVPVLLRLRYNGRRCCLFKGGTRGSSHDSRRAHQ